MNIFTRFLNQPDRDADLTAFIERWDALEALVVAVYRRKGALATDEARLATTRAWLREHYPMWERALRPYWRAAPVGGAPPTDDPFALLLATERAADFVDNWTAMQRLPAAREALNRLLVARNDDAAD